jgi:hypothetical protein
MKKLLLSQLFLAILLISAVGCDDDDPKKIVKTKIQLLTDVSGWDLKSVGGSTPIESAVLRFMTAGTFSRTASTTGVSNGTWSFIENEAKIRLTFSGGGTYEHAIVKLSETEFVYLDDQAKENVFAPL